MNSTAALRSLESAAVGQKGLITATQAQREGVERVQIQRLERAGIITRVRHGVYSLPSAEQSAVLEVRAAWLHLDPTRFAEERLFDDRKIVVSHTSAAEVHGLGVMIPNRHEFTTNYRKQSSQDDIQLRRGSLGSDDTEIVDGLLVTSIERTVSDLARSRIEFGYLADVVTDALSRPNVRVTDIVHVLDRWADRYGFGSGSALLDACRVHAGEAHDQTEQLARLSPAVREHLSKTISEAIGPTIQLQIQQILAELSAGIAPHMSGARAALGDMTERQRALFRESMHVGTRRPPATSAEGGLDAAWPTVLTDSLSTTLKTIAESSSVGIALGESKVPVTKPIAELEASRLDRPAEADCGAEDRAESGEKMRRRHE